MLIDLEFKTVKTLQYLFAKEKGKRKEGVRRERETERTNMLVSSRSFPR